MSLNNISGLKEAIGQYLGQDNLSGVYAQFIDVTESRINARVKIRAMESVANVTLAAGNQSIALPDYFRGARSVHIPGDTPYMLEYMTPEHLNNMNPTAGVPKAFTIRGTRMYFDCEADAAYTIRIVYYGQIEPLTNSNTTNYLTLYAPHVYLYGCLQAACEYTGDDSGVQKWGALFDQALSEIQQQDNFEKYGPAPVMRTEGYRW